MYNKFQADLTNSDPTTHPPNQSRCHPHWKRPDALEALHVADP